MSEVNRAELKVLGLSDRQIEIVERAYASSNAGEAFEDFVATINLTEAEEKWLAEWVQQIMSKERAEKN